LNLSKNKLGAELEELLVRNEKSGTIANWAYDLLYTSRNVFPFEIEEILSSISAMDAGPEFEISRNKLKEIARKLISEGEYDELSKPISEIREKAENLADDWLMCPLCQEAWESQSKLPMVRCPNCKNKLHNPNFKADV